MAFNKVMMTVLSIRCSSISKMKAMKKILGNKAIPRVIAEAK